MRTEQLTESRPAILKLTDAEAAAIRDAGIRLASRATWWGAAADLDASTRRVIDCEKVGVHEWRVSVRDAVGAVAVGDSLQLVIQPKIPITHLLYLFEAAKSLPRFASEPGLLAVGDSLWELIARWFVTAVQRVLRADLLRDYSPAIEELPAVRGSIVPLDTAQQYYSGRMTVACSFEEFELDTPLNRLLKAALRVVIANPALTFETRRIAQRVDMRFDDVGELRPDDFRSAIDRRSAHYRDALVLAKHILQNSGRSLEIGRHLVWTFLLRTPDLVEEGLRQLLLTRFGTQTIGRRPIYIAPSVTMNPDLVIADGLAVADVKYKLVSADLNRGDLYQVVAFAAGFECSHAAIMSFSTGDVELHRSMLQVGGITVRYILWPAVVGLPPRSAGDRFLDDVALWFDSVAGMVGSHQYPLLPRDTADARWTQIDRDASQSR